LPFNSAPFRAIERGSRADDHTCTSALKRPAMSSIAASSDIAREPRLRGACEYGTPDGEATHDRTRRCRRQ